MRDRNRDRRRKGRRRGKGKGKRRRRTLRCSRFRDWGVSARSELKGRPCSSCNWCEGGGDPGGENCRRRRGYEWGRIGGSGGERDHRSRCGSGGGSRRNRSGRERGAWRVGGFCEGEKEKGREREREEKAWECLGGWRSEGSDQLPWGSWCKPRGPRRVRSAGGLLRPKKRSVPCRERLLEDRPAWSWHNPWWFLLGFGNCRLRKKI